MPLLAPAQWARPVPVDGWRVEQHSASVTQLTATVLTPTNSARTLTWRLGAGTPAGQYAAIAVPVPRGFFRGADRVTLRLRSAAPMRVSVQLRASATGARWQRSVYVSQAPAEHSVALRELTPADAVAAAAPSVETIDAILIVVDTVNTTPGSAGEVWVSEVQAEGREK